MEEIRDFLVGKVSELCGVPKDNITDDTELIKDLGMKSATLVVLIAALEDQFDVDIDFMKFRRALSVSEAVAFLDDLVNG